MGFSAEQEAVINNYTDNILLLARAGSGKTFTVANKIAAETARGVMPEKILCLTFTVKAANEIKNAVAKYVGKTVKVYTIHGFCYDLIKTAFKKSGAFREPSIADEIDCGEILNSILKDYAAKNEYSLTDGEPTLEERKIVALVSAVKHEREKLGYGYFTEDGYGEALRELSKRKDYDDRFVCRKDRVLVHDYKLKRLLENRGEEFFINYKRRLFSSDLMDFDDLLFAAKSLTAETREGYDLVIVDEMQDTTDLEYSVISRFFNGSRVILLGDPYQTIYAWRGSDPERIIKDFKENYGAITLSLGKNRRSSPSLAYAGAYYLYYSFDGFKKPEKVEGDKIRVYASDTIEEETERIFSLIRERQCDKSNICVMTRSNRYVSDILAESEKLNARLDGEDRITFFTVDADFQFFRKPVAKDFLSALKLYLNPSDALSFSRLAQKYLGATRGEITAIEDYGKIGVSAASFSDSDAYDRGDNFYSLIEAYKNGDIVVYDTETTGLSVFEDEIIQISAVKIGKNGIADVFSAFIIPEREISAGALASHGYDLDHIRSEGGRSAKEVLTEFAKFTKGCVLAGHNSERFDDVFLTRQCNALGIKTEIVKRYDTLTISEAFTPNLKDNKLSTICEFFGIVNERAHDAFSDAEATAKCLAVYLEKFIIPTEKERRRILSLFSSKFEKIYRLREDIGKALKAKDPTALVKNINERLSVIGGKRSSADVANLFYKSIKGLKDAKDPEAFAYEFLYYASLSSANMESVIKNTGKVPLITVHQSKGCEFDEVIVAGASENEFPSYGAIMSGNEDEEKRVFYVATTRAKKKLSFTYSRFGKKRIGYPRARSPYISALPKELVEEI